MTERAKDTLQRVDVIACEDTRLTKRLCQRWNFKAPLVAYHEHSAPRVRPRLLEQMQSGKKVALVSDAGTPLVSDPGYKLVQAVVAAGLEVTALPGASAPTTALVVSGLPSDRYFFYGFLPRKSTARKTALAQISTVPATLIFFESPARLSDCLCDMVAVLGHRRAAVVRELTKKFEQVRRGFLSDLVDYYSTHGNPKGELVIVTEGPPACDEGGVDVAQELKKVLAGGRSLKDAVTSVSGAFGLPRQRVYKKALDLGQEGKE